MHVMLVHAHVSSDDLAAFEAATMANAGSSRAEPGNVRFDVLRSTDDPTRYVLYEAYVDEAAAAAHKQTAHYLEWRERVAPWMVEPRWGVAYLGLEPGDDDPAVATGTRAE